MPTTHDPSSGRDLLNSDLPGDWERLMDALGLPALLVLIERRMGPALKKHLQPEDVLQEGLLAAWRDRETLEWRGIAPFRRWFLRILEHRIYDLADRIGALKRGSGHTIFSMDGGRDGAGDSSLPDFVLSVTTTPGRRAALREQAAVLGRALAALPDDLRVVVRMRLFEERPSAEVADELGIGLSAVKHRLRAGARLLRERLGREYSQGDLR